MGRNAAYSVLAWTVFCIFAVLLRGIRWDEHFDLAEVVLRRMPYPDEHPLFIWTRYVRNLPIFLSTAVVWLFPSPELICAFRNTLWLMATIIPVLLLATILSRRALCGHTAVVLVLLGIHQSFDANYPVYAWPGFFSNGHIGRGFALTTLCLLISGNRRSAFFMLGLLPAIHPGQAPFIYIFAALQSLYFRKSPEFRSVARAMPLIAPGLILWGALWLVPGLSPAPATDGPYYSDVDAASIAQAYISQHPHWALPGTRVNYTNGNFVLAAVLLLVVAGARSEYLRDRSAGPWSMMSVYFLCVAAVVWCTMLFHWTLPSKIPYALVAWMPYRFTNHAATLLPAVLAAIFFPQPSGRLPLRTLALCALTAGLIFETLRPYSRSILDEALFERYLSTGDAVAFAWIGTAAALLMLNAIEDKAFQIGWSALSLAALAFFGFYHQFGAFCILLGCLMTALLGLFTPRSISRLAERRDPTALKRLAVAAAGLALLALLHREWLTRETLPRSNFDISVSSYLDSTDEPLTMMVSHPDQHRLQSRIRRPVLADGATASAIVYTPQIAPTIQKILEDIWGMNFFPPPDAESDPWSVTWTERSPERWVEVAEMYSFRYVISTDAALLPLEPVVVGEGETLYRIPRSVSPRD